MSPLHLVSRDLLTLKKFPTFTAQLSEKRTWLGSKLDKYFSLTHVTLCHRTTRFATFPDYLMVQMAKFSFGEDWVPKKYGKMIFNNLLLVMIPSFTWHVTDVLIDVPEELDLGHLRGRGLQSGEEELPEGEAPSSQQPPPPGLIEWA